ncbi:MAG: hydroxymethylbilane synthase [Desulfonauticus sp.]|nr:hydroxymethylbilane synthase [Desulfonauticus sp.]
MKNTIRIATRKSKLALWQAEFIASCIQKKYPHIKVEFVKITTTGDKILDVPLAKVGGKGLFVKEIEEALLTDQADIAVHSMKDVPTYLPEGLKIGIIPKREKNTDLFLSQNFKDLASLPRGARVGTSSLRRQAQLLRLYPHLEIISLRGNLDTRIKKLCQGDFQAIVVATAGVKRLGLKTKYMQELGPPQFFPAVAQGALGLEYLKTRSDLDQLLTFLDDCQTRYEVLAERAFLTRLEGGCQVPIGAYATFKEKEILLHGMVADLSGKIMLKDKLQGPYQEAEKLGVQLAEKILDQGAREILQEVYAQN